MDLTHRVATIPILVLTAALAITQGNRLAAQNTTIVRALAPPPADTCRAPANRIVGENCRAGNPREEWDIYNAGDPDIQGFATEASVNAGDTVSFKVKSHSPRYRIDIYRMGWYGGQGARLVQTLRPSVPLPQAQPECRVHSQTRLVDCGNWKVSAAWPVPRDAVSGVYAARLVREDDEPTSWRSEELDQAPLEKPAPLPHAYGALGLGQLRDVLEEKRASHILFVVRDDGGKSDVLVQLSDSDVGGVQSVWRNEPVRLDARDPGRARHCRRHPGSPVARLHGELQPPARQSRGLAPGSVLQLANIPW